MKGYIYTIIIATIAVVIGCSTTKHIPEGEQLYTGISKIKINGNHKTTIADSTLQEVEAALAKSPNNALLSSSSVRIPFPIGLWTYNAFYNKKGVGKWIFKRFASQPVLIGDVSPNIRSKAATNILHDYGYLKGNVDYRIITNKKNKKKAKVEYTINMRTPYVVDSLAYVGFIPSTDSIFKANKKNTALYKGKQFNINSLNEERHRLSNILRNNGRYYFRPDYFTYKADTTIVHNGHISLRMEPIPEMDMEAEKPFYVDNIAFTLLSKEGGKPKDSLMYKNLKIYYNDKLLLRPKIIYAWLNVPNQMGIYKQRKEERIQQRLNNIGIFQYVDVQFARQKKGSNNKLNMNVVTSLDKKYNLELDCNMKLKSNNQLGPASSLTLTRNNIFHGGEQWNVQLTAGYEWQVGQNKTKNMNSYDIGISSSLIFPRVIFPKWGEKTYNLPTTTTFKIYAEEQNRAKYYKAVSFGGNITYDYMPNHWSTHSFTPIKFSFHALRQKTQEFIQLEKNNPALYFSLKDQYIPSMEYTYTYNNTKQGKNNVIWWQTTFAEAGNLASVLSNMVGKKFGEKQKKLLGVPFAQFLKLNTELRHHYKINRHNTIASRITAGVIWPYGNTSSSPYVEQFYVGGANSIRAFSARSIGPGGTYPGTTRFDFINHVGDIRFEANLEYRYHLVGDLYGAVFLDAGNVWLMHGEKERPQGNIVTKNLFKQIALGTGTGIRYDLTFLVLRLDLGIPIHTPYNTGKKGYYNIESFRKSMVLNFAIGYPF